jgi:hypothetical protein
MKNETIKNYFLGKLSEAESSSLEIEIAENENLFEQAEIVEDDLIDDYLCDGLSASEKQSFESNYLTTQSRYEKVKFAQVFLSNLNKQPTEIEVISEQQSFWKSIFASFNFYKAFALSSLAILAVGGIYVVWQTQPKNTEIVIEQNSNQVPTPIVERGIDITNSNNLITKPNANSTPKQSNISKQTPTPTPTPTPEITTTPIQKESNKPILASFTLFPGALRSNGEQFIKVTSETNKINLRLALPKDSTKYSKYNATIKTVNGETVSTFSNLKSLNLTLSANKLKNETYIIFLAGNSPEKPVESIAEYTFRVQR